MSPSQLARIRVSLEDQGLSTDLAAVDSPLCGREEYCLNQLFRQKNFLDSFYDPAVRSLVFTLAPDLVREPETARDTATKLSKALQPFADTISLVRKVAVDAIEIKKPQDLRYIFRVHGDNSQTDLIRESYIDELARSIAKNGLLHPLVLLQKKDGRYKILCGFRRFQAIRRLGWKWVEAKTYSEEAFTTEDFFNISLAENTKRRNLNPIEIGNFLESAAEELGLNNTILAERFGESLGIGKPGANVSQSTIHKYRKLFQIRKRGESPEMIADVINDRLQFSIAAEILAPIQNPEDRDCLYLEVIKPLAPTRPQLVQIVKLLGKIDSRISRAIVDPFVARALARAAASGRPANNFITALQRKSAKRDQDREEKIARTTAELRQNFFGKKAGKLDFNITRSKRGKKPALTMHVRLKSDSMEEMIARLQKLLADKQQLKNLRDLLE
jgi:ParB family chromosome partitioning protein